jgi:hypothetical protein
MTEAYRLGSKGGGWSCGGAKSKDWMDVWLLFVSGANAIGRFNFIWYKVHLKGLSYPFFSLLEALVSVVCEIFYHYCLLSFHTKVLRTFFSFSGQIFNPLPLSSPQCPQYSPEVCSAMNVLCIANYSFTTSPALALESNIVT